MNSELLEILCCPLCYGDVVENSRSLHCKLCAHEYPLLDGIPDMRVYESKSYTNEFNKEQAIYESVLHDQEAESDYEKNVIRTFGTKTRLMVTHWADEITSAVTPPPQFSIMDVGRVK